MLQLFWNFLAYLGVPLLQRESEVKNVVLMNGLAMFSAAVAVFSLLSVLIFLPASQWYPVWLGPFIYMFLMTTPLILNAAGRFLAARLTGMIGSYIVLTLMAVLFGRETYFHFYMLVTILMQFFLFPDHQRRIAYVCAFIITATFVAIQFPYFDQFRYFRLTGEALFRVRLTNILGLGLVVTTFSGYIASTFAEAERYIEIERAKAERLLLNVLPETVANKLKNNPGTIADRFEHCTVLFADIVGFTELSRKLSPVELVQILNELFSLFDDLVEKHGLEKIKTIGDSYMVVGGLPDPDPDHAVKVSAFALDLLNTIQNYRSQHGYEIELRVGISSGEAVAGVIGKKRFVYDLWGDNVNTASRMESHGLPGRVQVTESTYRLISEHFELEERGSIDVKGMGSVPGYLLLRRSA